MKNLILIMALFLISCNSQKEKWFVKDINSGAVKIISLEKGYQIGDTVFTAIGQNYNVIIRRK